MSHANIDAGVCALTQSTKSTLNKLERCAFTRKGRILELDCEPKTTRRVRKSRRQTYHGTFHKRVKTPP